MSSSLAAADGPAGHVCPSCGARMAELGCKLRCACGYFEDCGDGLTPPPVDRPLRRRAG